VPVLASSHCRSRQGVKDISLDRLVALELIRKRPSLMRADGFPRQAELLKTMGSKRAAIHWFIR
jgi:hypothetical protein